MKKDPRFSITPVGVIVLICAVILFLAGFFYLNHGLIILGSSIILMILLSIVFAVITLNSITPVRKVPRTLVCYDPCLVGLGITNNSSFLSMYSLKIKDVHNQVSVDKPCYFFKVASLDTQITYYRHAFVQRGRIRFEGVWISTVFPFNLVKISRYYELTEEHLVWPEKDKGGLKINSRAISTVQDLDFSLKPFRPGDHMKFIHWSASYRANRLMTRRSSRNQLQPVWLRIDNRIIPHPQGGYIRAFDNFEKVISLTTGLAHELLSLGYEVGIITRSSYLTPVAGEKNYYRVQVFLSKIESGDGFFPKMSPDDFIINMEI